MSEKIENIYKFESEEGQFSYIYSLKKQNDFLGFDYYILSTKNNEPIIYEANNTIDLLQSNNINLIPIKRNTEEFKVFLHDLLTAISNNQKNKSRN